MAEETLRETIDRAATTVESGTVDTSTKVDDTPVADTPVADTKVADTKVVEPKLFDTKVVDTKVADTKVADTKVADTKVADTKVAALKPVAGVRPPESWKPAIREQHWAKLPVVVQAEIHRRERQIDEALQHTAEARKTYEQLGGMVGQYRDLFEYEKLPPLQSINNLLNISRTLRFAPAPQKAQLMATVINGFGVDLKLLDQALSMIVSPQDAGTVQAQNQAKLIEQAIAQQLAPMREFMGGLKTQQRSAQETADTEMKTEIQAFADDPKNEYFEIVRDVMADILEAGASRGQKISLQDAYQRAILANNDLAGQFNQQKLEQAASKLSAPAAQAAQRASLSVTGSPAGESASANVNTVRGALEAAVAQHSGRG